MPCQWIGDHPCQFSATAPNTQLFDGVEYCPLHMPLEAGGLKGPVHEIRDLLAAADANSIRDWSGVQFPEGCVWSPPSMPNSAVGSLVRGAVFADGAEIQITTHRVDFTKAKFRGAALVRFQAGQTLVCDGVEFCGGFKELEGKPVPLEVGFSGSSSSHGSPAKNWSFVGAVINGHVRFNNVRFTESLSFNSARVTAPLWLEHIVDWSQQTTFTRTRFKRASTPEGAEGSYRSAKTKFNAHRARDLEGLFYSLEKRCQRNGMRWWEPTKWLNFLYWLCADYGRGYLRALASLVIVQLPAYYLYGTYALDWGSVTASFTAAQVFKPFEVFAARWSQDSAYAALLAGGNLGKVQLVAVFHSILSLTFLALFLLAVRWRFKRD